MVLNCPVRLRVPAKINLHLQIGPLRADDYHDIVTVYQAVDLYDDLTANSSEGLKLIIRGEGADILPVDSTNLIIKAAAALAKQIGIEPNVRFDVFKRIPVGGGLGSGSADAAAALVACNILWETHLDGNELARMAADLGEDVPFHIIGMMAFGVGHKQPLVPISTSHDLCWVLGILHVGLLTKSVFAKLSEITNEQFCQQSFERRCKVAFGTPWGRLDPKSLASFLVNDLQCAAIALLPEIELALVAGSAAGAIAGCMTGSGSSCIFLGQDKEHAESIAQDLRRLKIFRKVVTALGPVTGVSRVSQAL
jgi:4-diphosphocytidyl-2-C-methyl-D-erythritol kinase